MPPSIRTTFILRNQTKLAEIKYLKPILFTIVLRRYPLDNINQTPCVYNERKRCILVIVLNIPSGANVSNSAMYQTVYYERERERESITVNYISS